MQNYVSWMEMDVVNPNEMMECHQTGLHWSSADWFSAMLRKHSMVELSSITCCGFLYDPGIQGAESLLAPLLALYSYTVSIDYPVQDTVSNLQQTV